MDDVLDAEAVCWQALAVPLPPPALPLDLGDFDAVGIIADVIIALRIHAIEASVDAAATISAPNGWHRVVITARSSGHVVLGVRYLELSTSRYNNLAPVIAARGWQLDEDEDGATRRYPPGTEASAAAFEVLAVITSSGAPADVRSVTAVDGFGVPVVFSD